jgi:hypothetical protein
MNPLSTPKEIREIIRSTTDRELVKLIFALQKDVFAIESHRLKPASEPASLKQQLKFAGRITS